MCEVAFIAKAVASLEEKKKLNFRDQAKKTWFFFPHQVWMTEQTKYSFSFRNYAVICQP